jgi:F0F1-type ATP synthase assembly protein I
MRRGPVDPKEFGYYMTLAQVGWEFVIPALIGLGLDRWLGWAPWGVIGGAVVGLVAGFTHLVLLSNRADDNGPSRRRDEA